MDAAFHLTFGDAVVVGALLLLGIGATFLVGENFNRTQKTQLSSGAIGAAIGLLAVPSQLNHLNQQSSLFLMA